MSLSAVPERQTVTPTQERMNGAEGASCAIEDSRGPAELGASKRAAIQIAVKALVTFKREFNRELTPAVLGELYVALELDLVVPGLCNHPGFDLLSSDGRRYQVKVRGSTVQNVDLNNFDFDDLMLVNLEDDYSLKGMWRLPVDQARSLFVYRRSQD